jgi:hypothetical protein
MGKKTIGAIVIILIAILALIVVYNFSETQVHNSLNLTELNVSSEGPFPLSDLIEEIENKSYYDGYDNDTLNWMKYLGNKSVFSGDGIFVVMSSEDAKKIPSVYATDVFIYEIFECNVVETHSLGDTDYPKDVLLVENVNYLRESVEDMPGGGA